MTTDRDDAQCRFFSTAMPGDDVTLPSRFGARISYYWGLNLEAWSVGLTYDF